MIIHSRKANQFQPKGDHTKYQNKNGLYVPSVTNIIKVIPKDALIYWANNLGWKRKSVKRELEYAAEIGTLAHEAVEKIILKEPEPLVLMHDSVRAINSFKLWWKDHEDDVEVIAIEKQMANDEYGGTSDLICRYKKIPMIFDFKTSGDFYFTMFVQLAAYVHLYEELTGEGIEDVAVLRLDKKYGERAKLLKLSDIKNGDIDFYYQVFEQCLNLYKSLYILENDWKGR